MKITIRATRDTITPDLARRLLAMKNPRPALQAMGLVITSWAQRSFNTPALRPASWAALAASTLAAKARQGKSSATLKAHGTLWRSPRIITMGASSVTIGTHTPYAHFHQLGTKHIPARPFFPFTKSGQLIPQARTRVQSALRKALEKA